MREQVIRIFGFSTAGADEVKCCAGRLPIQQAPMVYNEVALKHFDYFMDACAKVRRLTDTGYPTDQQHIQLCRWCRCTWAGPPLHSSVGVSVAQHVWPRVRVHCLQTSGHRPQAQTLHV